MTETLTLLDAERLSGISRRTLGRLLADGRLSGERTPTGWQIDAESLAAVQAAGLAGRRSTSTPTTSTPEVESLRTEVESLRSQIAAAEADAAGLRTEVESLRAEVAEQIKRAEVAEAVATERGRRLDDVDTRLAQALDALTAGQMIAGAQIAERGPAYAASVALAPKRPRVWDRWRNRHD